MLQNFRHSPLGLLCLVITIEAKKALSSFIFKVISKVWKVVVYGGGECFFLSEGWND